MALPAHRPRPTNQLIHQLTGAWDLTSDARSAFHILTLIPIQLPGWAGTHDDVPIFEWSTTCSVAKSTRRLVSSQRGHGLFGSPSPVYPGDPLVADHLLYPGTGNLKTGGCSWLLDLEPLPPSHCPYSSSRLAASVDAQHIQLNSAYRWVSSDTTLSDHTLANPVSALLSVS
jgi:hypothetical protein